jgi:hypothetical protein
MDLAECNKEDRYLAECNKEDRYLAECNKEDRYLAECHLKAECHQVHLKADNLSE